MDLTTAQRWLVETMSEYQCELSARLRKRSESGDALCRTAPCPLAGRFHPDEELVPSNVIAGWGWSPTTESPIQQFEVDDLVCFHEDPVGKRTTAGAGDLIAEQLDRAVEDTVIVWLKNALFPVVDEPNHARLFDSRPDRWNRFQQRHTQPFWRVWRFG